MIEKEKRKRERERDSQSRVNSYTRVGTSEKMCTCREGLVY